MQRMPWKSISRICPSNNEVAGNSLHHGDPVTQTVTPPLANQKTRDIEAMSSQCRADVVFLNMIGLHCSGQERRLNLDYSKKLGDLFTTFCWIDMLLISPYFVFCLDPRQNSVIVA